MDDELRSLVEETKELVEENNKILKSMRRNARFGALARIVYWIVILGIGVGAFYYVKPYVEQLMKVYESVKQTESKIHDAQKSFNIKTIFNSN